MSVTRTKPRQAVQPPMPEKRFIKSFEADDDVAAMLARAEADGIKLVFLCNTALRKLLTDRGYSRKRDVKAA